MKFVAAWSAGIFDNIDYTTWYKICPSPRTARRGVLSTVNK